MVAAFATDGRGTTDSGQGHATTAAAAATSVSAAYRLQRRLNRGTLIRRVWHM